MKKEIEMTSGNIFKKLIFFSIPLILSSILQLCYNAADLIICGKFGSIHSTAAISSTNALINLYINLFLGLAVGSNVLMARCYGSNDKEKGQKVVYTAMVFSFIVGIIIGLFGFSTSHIFLKLMGTPEEIIDLSTQYLQIYFLGMPFSMIYNFGAAIFRATGDTKRPFIYLSISGVVNIILNLIFVIVFKMDVPGVSLATIISQAVSALLILNALFKNKGFFEFKFKEIRFYKQEAKEILNIGLPAGLQGVIFSLSNVLIQSSINSLGTDVVDGNGAASSLEGFIYNAMISVAQSCAAFVSANYGAKNKKNIKKSIIYSSILIICVNFIIGSIILLFQNQLLQLYIHTDIAIFAAKERLIIITTTYFLCGLMDNFAYSLRGINYSLLPTIITLIGACGLRIMWIFCFFPIDKFHNIQGLTISYPISWLVTALIQLILFIILFKKLKFNKQN